MKLTKLKKILLVFVSFFAFSYHVFAYNKAVVDITEMDIYEIQEAIDKGYLTYELLAKLYLDRIEAYDKDFNTIITLNDNLIEEAKEKDLEYQKNGRSSLIFGIPILVKDNIDVYGIPTTDGTKSLSDNYPKDDAEVIKNLKEQGALIIGKTNMSEFAFKAFSSTSSYGTVKNAYDTYFSSYGSSGGTAVAVSLQFGLLGIGTDTNASIRVPASANNVIGFKPTFNLISTDGVIAYDITRDTVGAITKNVSENAILMANMVGKEDDYYLEDLDKLSLKDIKLGVIDDFLYGNASGLSGTESTYTETKNLMEDTLDLLKEQGVEIIHIKDFYKEKYNNINNKTLGGWTMCYAFNNYIKDSSSKIDNFYKLVISSGHIYSLWDYVTDCSIDIKTIDDYDSIKKEYNTYIKSLYQKYEIDFLVYPTTKNRVLRITEDENNLASPGYAIASVLGYPAVSISIGNDVDGLYYGMEVVSLKNTENKLYQFLYQYEKVNYQYELSSLTPPLYEVPREVTELVELYEKNTTKRIIINFNADSYREYKKVDQEVKDFITSYNNLSNDEVGKATDLLERYKTATINTSTKINITIYAFIIPIISLLVFILIIIYKKKKKRLNKKRSYVKMYI